MLSSDPHFTTGSTAMIFSWSGRRCCSNPFYSPWVFGPDISGLGVETRKELR
jgi:hypothetical protein